MLRKPREPSVRGIMYSSLTLGVIISIIKVNILNIINFILLLSSLILFYIQFMSINYVNESIRKKECSNLYKPILMMILPYIVPIILSNPLLLLYLITLKATFFTLILLTSRIDPRNIFSYLIGTTLITTVYLDPPIFLGITLEEVYIIWILIATYYTATSYYIESRLAFRDVDPIKPFLTWIWVIPVILILYRNPIILISMVEPTVKFLKNLYNREKVSDRVEIVRMGRLEMKRGYLFTLLLIITIILNEIISIYRVSIPPFLSK